MIQLVCPVPAPQAAPIDSQGTYLKIPKGQQGRVDLSPGSESPAELPHKCLDLSGLLPF